MIATVVTAVVALAILVFATRPNSGGPDPTASISTPLLETTQGSSTVSPSTTLQVQSLFAMLPGTWSPVSGESPLESRVGPTAVWTGREMIVWGGFPSGVDADDTGGAAYDPGTGEWRELPPPPIQPAFGHSAVWTGSEMIVWGGTSVSGGLSNAGSAYDPETDVWREVTNSILTPRKAHSTVWTGSEMIIVGGYDSSQESLTSAAAYDPETDTWRDLADSPIRGGVPELDPGQTAVWTGRTVIVYGQDPIASPGADESEAVVASYDPATDSWTTLVDPLSQPRIWHSAVWTGSEMIVWGGSGRESTEPEGVAYDPATSAWRSLTPSPVTPRDRHTAVWTGIHMIIWGGSPVAPIQTSEHIGGGIAYDPNLDQWLNIAAPGISGRTYTSVWTGNSMIIWTGDPTQAGIFTPTP
jgi:hypothetical protein